MKQVWSPYITFKYFQELKGDAQDALLSELLPNGVYCTENFTWAELLLNQKYKDGLAPSLFVLENLCSLANRLQAMRDTVFGGAQILITSAWRDEDYNAKIGGASNSKHILGQAADIYVVGMAPLKVQNLLRHHSGGLGAYQNFTHVDIARRRRW